MKRIRFLAYAVGLLGLTSAAVLAAPCDGTSACQTPGTTGLAAPVVTAASIRGLQVRNSGAAANATGTTFWFFAYATSLPAPSTASGSSDFVDPGDGLHIRAPFAIADPASPTSANDLMQNGRINSTQASQNYDIYAQACRPGLFNDASANNCSGWVKVYAGITTLSLPSNVFFSPVAGDVGSSSITVRVDGAKVDPSDPLAAEIIIRNVDSGNTDTTLYPVTFGLTMPITATTSPSYAFVPNTQYRYLGRLQYPFQFTTQENKGPFYTTPVTPGAVSASPTHFTVTLNWTNAAGAIGNPKNTDYKVTVTGATNPAAQDILSTTGNLGVAGNPAEAMTAKFTNLSPGGSYQACIQAQNEGGNVNWTPSASVCTNFTTLSINASYSVTNVQTNQATFNVTLTPPTGITDYIVEHCVGGVGGTCVQDAKKPWSGSSISDTMSSLTPNTAYEYYIQLFENSDSSAFIPQPDQGQAVNQFTTTPNDPVPATFTAPTANSLAFTWGANSNPGSTVYEINYSADSSFGTGVTTVTATGTSLTVTNGGGTPVSPETTYFARIHARNITGSPWLGSNTVAFAGSPTTPALITQAASITPNPVNTVTGTLNVQVDSSNNAPGFTYNWVIVPPGGVLPPTMCGNNNSATGNSCVVTFHQIGTGYSATVTITDALLRTYTSNVTFNVVPAPQSATISPLAQIINQGSPAVQFSATATDQFGNPIASPSVTWSTPGGNGGNTLSAGGLFNPVGSAGTYNVQDTVTMNGVTASSSTQITVRQAVGSVTITGPAGNALNQTQTFTYTAVVRDLAGAVINSPSIVWTIDAPASLVGGDPANTINSATGLFTASNPGSYTVRAVASVNGTSAPGTSPITVNVIPASVGVSPLDTSINQGNSAIQYTAIAIDPYGVTLSNPPVVWTTPGGSGGNTLSAGGSFNPVGSAGNYTIQASVTLNGVTQSSSTLVHVLPSAGSVTVTGPASGSLNQTQTFTFTAVVRDQSNTVITNSTITWSIVGSAGQTAGDPNNVIDPASGLFTAQNPGVYTVQASASINGSTSQGTSVITVNAIPGFIVVSPSSQTVITGNSQLFSEIVQDPYHVVLPGVTVVWGGSLTSAGTLSTLGPSTSVIFSSATSLGLFNLTATTGSVSATVPVTIVPAGAQVDSLVFVMSPGNKGGTLTVTGHDNFVHAITSNFSSDSSITFTPVSGTSADGIPLVVAVNFSKAGTFTLTDSLGSGVSSATVVVVPQVLSGIQVCPAGGTSCPNSITVQTLQNQQFTATGADQFGNPLPLSSVQWSSSGGNINASGSSAFFSATTLGQNIQVTATDPVTKKTGFISVNVLSFDVSGAYAFPVPYKASAGNGGVIHFKNLGSSSQIRIFTASGRKVFSIDLTQDTYDWPIRNSSGENIASGVYFYVIESQGGKKDGKLIIIQ